MLFVLLCNCSPCLYIEMMRKLNTDKSNNQGNGNRPMITQMQQVVDVYAYLCHNIITSM